MPPTDAATALTLVRTLSQDDFDRFARLSGDDNAIHLDARFAAATRFGRPVAHGMLLYTVLRGLVARLAPRARPGRQTLRFPAPAFAGEPLRFAAVVDAASRDPLRVRVCCERIADGTLVCEGETVLAGAVP